MNILVTGLNGQAVLANFQVGTTNSKTGDGVQIYLVPYDWVETGRIGDDAAVCGDCPFAGGNGCYVRKGTASWGLHSKVRSLHQRLIKGKLIINEPEEVIGICRDRFVRFGAYGETVLLGESLIRKITEVCDGWTGYTHQIKRFPWASKYFMVSSEGNLLGGDYREFLVIPKGSDRIKGMTLCPASKEAGRKLTCNNCLLCQGTSSEAKKSIYIFQH